MFSSQVEAHETSAEVWKAPQTLLYEESLGEVLKITHGLEDLEFDPPFKLFYTPVLSDAQGNER